MGADCDYRWVKTDDIGKYNWSDGWIRQMYLPDVPIEFWEDIPGFENLECFIVGLLDEMKIECLLNNGTDFVFDCNINTIDVMIAKCREFIHELVDLDSDGDKKRGMEIAHVFYNEYYEWNGELAENLCRTLMALKNERENLLKHAGWSLIVEILY